MADCRFDIDQQFVSRDEPVLVGVDMLQHLGEVGPHDQGRMFFEEVCDFEVRDETVSIRIERREDFVEIHFVVLHFVHHETRYELGVVDDSVLVDVDGFEQLDDLLRVQVQVLVGLEFAEDWSIGITQAKLAAVDHTIAVFVDFDEDLSELGDVFVFEFEGDHVAHRLFEVAELFVGFEVLQDVC